MPVWTHLVSRSRFVCWQPSDKFLFFPIDERHNCFKSDFQGFCLEQRVQKKGKEKTQKTWKLAPRSIKLAPLCSRLKLAASHHGSRGWESANIFVLSKIGRVFVSKVHLSSWTRWEKPAGIKELGLRPTHLQRSLGSEWGCSIIRRAPWLRLRPQGGGRAMGCREPSERRPRGTTGSVRQKRRYYSSPCQKYPVYYCQSTFNPIIIQEIRFSAQIIWISTLAAPSRVHVQVWERDKFFFGNIMLLW